jgi:hypothetical protein
MCDMQKAQFRAGFSVQSNEFTAAADWLCITSFPAFEGLSNTV